MCGSHNLKDAMLYRSSSICGMTIFVDFLIGMAISSGR